ncbi:hypothetical protein V6N12_025040 [Hibiscus sabdariffa]|uniref:RNase H type-1 domain-containing protein n=1 Tax=Hibiscus sabdariffa TaxID=183260 RepID=A0ABR2BLK3_9ROSI
MSITTWMHRNLFDPTYVTHDLEWPSRFAVTCWLLWKRRCCLVLGSEEGYRGPIRAWPAFGGGMQTDDLGQWLLGFARFVGRCDVLVAELWGIHNGLLRAWGLCYPRVELESDCLEAVRILTSSLDALVDSALVTSIKELLVQECRVVVCHVGRSINRVADMVALWDRGLVGEQLTLLDPYANIAAVLEEDISGSISAIGESVGVG